jgi:hypothetical protein
MERVDTAVLRAVRTLLAGQPMSDGKLSLAWRVAAGSALARSADVSWSPDGTIYLRARSEAWRGELRRARGLIAVRLRELLGDAAARRVHVLD